MRFRKAETLDIPLRIRKEHDTKDDRAHLVGVPNAKP
jgi:hypothetical protein